MRGLFITINGIEDEAFGGAKATIRNYKALKKFADIDIYHVHKRSSLKSLISIIQLNYPPFLNDDAKKIRKLILANDYDFVFCDYSAVGKMMLTIKKLGVKTILFYHNCESEYISVRFGSSKSLKKTVYQFLVDRNERIASKHADCRLVFTKRDKEKIENLYNVNVDYVIPIGIEDKFISDKLNTSTHNQYCLLFGPAGTANIEAFSWFLENVSPYLLCKTLVAGKGFQKYMNSWKSDKVEVRGYVNDIIELYSNATCVAIPLFSGGGMKIKTAEALMFGKYIYGTDEAFVGYDFSERKIGGRCNTAQEFISAINAHVDKNISNFNLYAREQYLKNYSIESAVSKFSDVIKQIK